MFTKDHRISDNSVQINIKSTFTVYEYIIVYEYMLFSISFVFLFIVTLSQHIHTLVTLVSYSHNLFQLDLLDHRH